MRPITWFPAELIQDTAGKPDVVQHNRKIDIRMIVWTLIMGHAINKVAYAIAKFQRI